MELISKKDLLARTGISYGQLYRWKRERLLPEEWFIKQSSYTGQETFFPKEQMLSRIQAILQAKDQYSLEELAAIFSPEAGEAFVSVSDLAGMEEIEAGLLPDIERHFGRQQYGLMQLALFAAISQAVTTGSMTVQQAGALLLQCKDLPASISADSVCCFLLIGNTHHIVFAKGTAQLVFDNAVKVIYRVAFGELVNRLKLKYGKKLS